MTKNNKTPAIKETIWINENQAAQLNYDLLDGITTGIDHYVKAVNDCLPTLCVVDGVLNFEEIWLQTSLPKELLIHIVKECPIVWPHNVERIQIDNETFVSPPTEEAPQGGVPEE